MKTLARKIFNKAVKMAMWPVDIVSSVLAVPVLIIAHMLRPVILIRFSELISDRIGHLAANTELYLCNKDLASASARMFDIFYLARTVSNEQLMYMWRRTGKLRIWRPYYFIKILDMTARNIPFLKEHSIQTSDKDGDNIIAGSEKHLFFTEDEEHRGRQALSSIGVPDGASFVCFYSRDPIYLDTSFPGVDWKYHDYRNSDIGNYILAAEEMTRVGHYAVRMGSLVDRALNTDNGMIIDYAAKGRSDFMDIYLSAKCSFFIASTGGINAVPRIFRRSVAYVNFVPLSKEHLSTCTSAGQSLFIPKKMRSRKKGRLLRFSEILDLNPDLFLKTRHYNEEGIDVIENSPEEIAALSIEMDQRLKGVWQAREDDEKLQKLFWSIFAPKIPNEKIYSRIGADFLRKNTDLLG